MAATGFSDMWNPEHLYYDGEVGRIFHRKWHGLSFAHEVEYEQGEDPIGNFAPIAERMRSLGTTKFLDTSFPRGWMPRGIELLIFAPKKSAGKTTCFLLASLHHEVHKAWDRPGDA